VGRASLLPVEEPQAGCRVCWTWPPARFAEQCLLAVAPAEPGLQDSPENLTLYYRLPFGRQEWETGGGSRLLPADPAWSGAWVVVWAVVDLGFQSFYSRPLVLGRLPERAHFRWQNWRLLASRRGQSACAEEESKTISTEKVVGTLRVRSTLRTLKLFVGGS
jgi:hypothetical protein